LNINQKVLDLPNLIDNTNPVQTEIGKKYYELSNHLGNVLTTISDRKIEHGSGSTVDYYTAEVISATDYYPFGFAMDKRNFSSSEYRFGFNGQEKDDEVYGTEGTSYTAEFWQYDARLARRWNVDPVVKEHESPYACFANNPIWFGDPNGADSLIMHIGEGKEVGDGNYKAKVYEVTFSYMKDGVERKLDTEPMHLVTNLKHDNRDDNSLSQRKHYKLIFWTMKNAPDWTETIIVRGAPDVTIHRWENIHWFRGCKGVTKDLQYGEDNLPTTSLNESISAALSIRELYDKYKTDLTGDKFLLKVDSKAPETVIKKVDAKSTEIITNTINPPLIITQSIPSSSNSESSSKRIGLIKRVFYKIFNNDKDD
jgi:RHS repeat-associated protein